MAFALAALACSVCTAHAAAPVIVFRPAGSADLAAGGVGDRIAVGDFNRDGHPDLAVTPDLSSPESYPNVDGVTLLFGDGEGAFPNTVSLLAGEYLTGIAVADFNGDGAPDLATAEGFDGAGLTVPIGLCNSVGPRVPVLLGAGNGSFALNPPCLDGGRRPGAVAAGDFDEDGFADLAVTLSSADLVTADRDTYFLSGNGDGSFAAGQVFKSEKSHHAIAADFNRDGHLDLALSGAVYLGSGRGIFAAGPTAGGGEAVGDLNGDGLADLASLGTNKRYYPADDVVTVRLGQPGGGFAAFGAPLPTGSDPGVESHPIAVAIADLDGDGYGDIVVANGETDDVAIYLRDPAAGFHPRQHVSTRATTARGTVNTRPQALAVADWNRDGHPDIVVANYNPSADGTPGDGTVTVLVQDAAARPAAADDAAVTAEDTTVLVDVYANDFDRTGILDANSIALARSPTHGTAANAGGGKFSYTPAAGFAGVDDFTYTLRNTGGTVSNVATATVIVTRSNKLPVARDDAATTLSNAAVTLDVLANDSDPDGSLLPSSVTLLSQPASGSASADPATGAVTYQPGAAGNYSFTYTAQDNGGALTNVAKVSVSVTAANTPPLAHDDSAATVAGAPVAIYVLANDSDPDGDLLDRTKIAIATPPAHGGVTVNPSTGAVTYTPAAGYSGADSFVYTVKDIRGATSNPASVTVTVNPGNQAPTAANGVLATSEDTAASGTLTASDPEGSPLTFSIVTNGSKGTATVTNAATGAYTYTPNANANGADSFSFRASDGSLNSTPATVSITIAAVNDAPVPSAPAIATNEDTAGTSQVAPNDPDGGSAYTYAVSQAPAHGNASVSPSGLVSYSPLANYNGADSLVVRVTDPGGTSGQVAIPVMVAAVNDPPLAGTDTAATLVRVSTSRGWIGRTTLRRQPVPVTLNVLANDSDADGTLNPATVTLVTLPTSGTATVNPASGAITYVPGANTVGAVSFSYTVQDNAGAASSPALVTITVTAAMRPRRLW
jgi:VCBS repeat-containing protein